MDVAIGIGNTLLDMAGPTLVEWARRAEARGFSSVASIGRAAWPAYDELAVFAAAAAVTERIGLLTDVLLAPTFDTARLAKLSATVDALSGGRLPRVVCLTYFGLGHEEESHRQLRSYYAYTPRADAVASGAARSADEIRRRIEAYDALGADELVFTPSVADVDQVDLLADIALGSAGG